MISSDSELCLKQRILQVFDRTATSLPAQGNRQEDLDVRVPSEFRIFDSCIRAANHDRQYIYIHLFVEVMLVTLRSVQEWTAICLYPVRLQSEVPKRSQCTSSAILLRHVGRPQLHISLTELTY